MTRTARKIPGEAAILKIDLRADSELWKDAKDAPAVVRRVVAEAASILSISAAELAIVLTDDSAIRSLNRVWRGIDAPTNVLSFPTSGPSGADRLIGDIVVAYETVAREAAAQGKPFAHHLAHLAVHGFLHLLGYDHERDSDAERMEGIERDVLRHLRIPDPYGSSSKGDGRERTLLKSKS
jgi:probable rRNA maturation factor